MPRPLMDHHHVHVAVDVSMIDAPESQVIFAGSSGSLNCSYPGGLITWKRSDNSIFGGSFSPATFDDEGHYTCDIYVPSSAASIAVPVVLYVVGKCLSCGVPYTLMVLV